MATKTKKTTTKRPAKKKNRLLAVMVTTDKRGVFFGYCSDTSADPITLTKARNCVYWSADVKGFLGLAATGPTSGCRIGPAAPSLTLRGVTSVVTVSDSAARAWESAPWR